MPNPTNLHYLNRQGYSLIELLVASVIGKAGLAIGIHLFSFVNTQNTKLTEERALHSLQEGIKRNIAQDLKVYWLELNNRGCHGDSSMALGFTSFTPGLYYKRRGSQNSGRYCPKKILGALSLRLFIHSGSAVSLKLQKGKIIRQLFQLYAAE